MNDYDSVPCSNGVLLTVDRFQGNVMLTLGAEGGEVSGRLSPAAARTAGALLASHADRVGVPMTGVVSAPEMDLAMVVRELRDALSTCEHGEVSPGIYCAAPASHIHTGDTPTDADDIGVRCGKHTPRDAAGAVVEPWDKLPWAAALAASYELVPVGSDPR